MGVQGGGDGSRADAGGRAGGAAGMALGVPAVAMAVVLPVVLLLGAVAGVAVNMLILTPTRLRSTEESVRRVVEEAGQSIRSVAGGLNGAWDHRRARSLSGLTGQARSALERSRG